MIQLEISENRVYCVETPFYAYGYVDM